MTEGEAGGGRDCTREVTRDGVRARAARARVVTGSGEEELWLHPC